MRGLHELKGLVGAGAHFGRDVEIGPERRGGEESGNDGVEAAGDGGALAGELGGNDAEVGAELGDVPPFAAEEAELGGGRDDGVALAGEGLDEGGFAAAGGRGWRGVRRWRCGGRWSGGLRCRRVRPRRRA
jgi:hypothetical protein